MTQPLTPTDFKARLLALVAAARVGVGAAMLLAPDKFFKPESGTETLLMQTIGIRDVVIGGREAVNAALVAYPGLRIVGHVAEVLRRVVMRNVAFVRGLPRGVVDLVIAGQRVVQSDSCAKRLDRFVAGMRKGRCRLEADPRSPNAEGDVGRMVELQRFGQV